MPRVWWHWMDGNISKEGVKKDLDETFDLTDTQRRMLAILLRQYLCDGLRLTMKMTDKISTEEAEALWKQVHSELMEDAVAGPGAGTDDLEIARFLLACVDGVRDEEYYFSLFMRALGPRRIPREEVLRDMAKGNRFFADKRLKRFIEQRGIRIASEKRCRDNEPPPWMDEFEYIDWVITH